MVIIGRVCSLLFVFMPIIKGWHRGALLLGFRFTRHAEDKIRTELLRFGIDKIVVVETIRNPDETLYDTKLGDM